ncbi:2'-5' RNA ligase family protein [Pedobacter sp. SYSU D00535]|uniref:2'-5' RNA ligase family protein n=1 Tax=Pedobacter sp. SYSU D00535 TaxID=2810308 RepID=UPI001A95C836|nr:2'-5' RNA ligase family protein [Pedobacter sp. SYSU D00535]
MQVPLILTLTLDDQSFVHLNALRKKYFPPERNYLDAHLTLFHNLPYSQLAEIEGRLEQLSQQQEVFSLTASEVLFLGRGVAFKLESTILQLMHKQLQNAWHPYLIPQDKQKLWPHVTIQNKVSPEAARNLQQTLTSSFKPFTIQAEGFSLWKYLSGPWELYRQFPFLS